ncbi:hypothetical protein M8494_08980 [Serratia ureilytica]
MRIAGRWKEQYADVNNEEVINTEVKKLQRITERGGEYDLCRWRSEPILLPFEFQPYFHSSLSSLLLFFAFILNTLPPTLPNNGCRPPDSRR